MKPFFRKKAVNMLVVFDGSCYLFFTEFPLMGSARN